MAVNAKKKKKGVADNIIIKPNKSFNVITNQKQRFTIIFVTTLSRTSLFYSSI